MVELLKRFEEKENLFANFPIGTTIQDGGKRKRSTAVDNCCYAIKCFFAKIYNFLRFLSIIKQELFISRISIISTKIPLIVLTLYLLYLMQVLKIILLPLSLIFRKNIISL